MRINTHTNIHTHTHTHTHTHAGAPLNIFVESPQLLSGLFILPVLSQASYQAAAAAAGEVAAWL